MRAGSRSRPELHKAKFFSSLPDSGPGRAVNGNFVLTEFQVDATPLALPEPGAIVLAALGAAGFGPLARRRRRRG